MDTIESLYQGLQETLAPSGVSVYADLTSDAQDITSQIPVVVYQVISDTPHLWGDDRELARRLTVQISVITEDGDDAAIVSLVRPLLASLGWLRESTDRFTEDRLRITALRYVRAEESEDET